MNRKGINYRCVCRRLVVGEEMSGLTCIASCQGDERTDVCRVVCRRLAVGEEMSGLTCVASCQGRADGLYQACDTCDSYTECVAGSQRRHHCDDHSCWDDFTKRCESSSETCQPCSGEPLFHVSKCSVIITNDIEVIRYMLSVIEQSRVDDHVRLRLD